MYYQTMISGYYYGDGTMDVDCLVQNLTGAVSKENKDDLEKVRAYFSTVIRDKKDDPAAETGCGADRRA